MDASEIKKLSRLINGTIPSPKVMPTKKDYNRKRAKSIPQD